MVQVNQVSVSSKKISRKFSRHTMISYSGYAALGFGTIAGVTGFRKVNIPNRMKIHKYSAIMAGVTSFLHLGLIKVGFNKKNIKSN